MRFWALFLGLLVACDGSPVIYVEISTAPDFPALDTFSRVTLAIDRCIAAPLTVLELDASPEADGTAPHPVIEIDLLPGTEAALWLAAWEPCSAATCVDSRLPVAGCVCQPGKTPDRAAIAYEACSTFAKVEAGKELRVSLTLTATAGLCPTTRPPCSP